jgi:hypothetical protein
MKRSSLSHFRCFIANSIPNALRGSRSSTSCKTSRMPQAIPISCSLRLRATFSKLIVARILNPGSSYLSAVPIRSSQYSQGWPCHISTLKPYDLRKVPSRASGLSPLSSISVCLLSCSGVGGIRKKIAYRPHLLQTNFQIHRGRQSIPCRYRVS